MTEEHSILGWVCAAGGFVSLVSESVQGLINPVVHAISFYGGCALVIWGLADKFVQWRRKRRQRMKRSEEDELGGS